MHLNLQFLIFQFNKLYFRLIIFKIMIYHMIFALIIVVLQSLFKLIYITKIIFDMKEKAINSFLLLYHN